ncbi:DUF2164 domain-containing protein [Flavobacteriales bacterium]|nr:DUF2164 domain-containing protein [Flavobacteriales bacterium]
MKHDWERLSNEESRLLKEDLILFFKNELDVEIGFIAAEKILKFFLKSASNKLYNKGIDDAKGAVENRHEELQFDLEDLFNQ